MISVLSCSSVFNRIHTSSDVALRAEQGGIRTVTSRVQKAPFAFSSLVLSVNLGPLFDGCLLVEVQVGDGKNWSPFFKLGLLSETFQQSFPDQLSSWGLVRVDELVLSVPMRYYRFRLRMEGEVPLRGLGVSGVRSPFSYCERKATRLPQGKFVAAVEPISQKEQKSPDKNRICSPTSVCMALNALGRRTALVRVLQSVYDRSANVYGNWFFNTAYASQQGLDVYFRRFSSLEELERFCTPNSLVVASIAYDKNELPNAAHPKTQGHLVLIRGYENGKILVADPAAETADGVLRAYDAVPFARAWLKNKRGASYILRKR